MLSRVWVDTSRLLASSPTHYVQPNSNTTTTSNHATNHQHTRNNSVAVVIICYLSHWQCHWHTCQCHWHTLYLIYHPTTQNHTSETPNSNLVSSPCIIYSQQSFIIIFITSHHNQVLRSNFLFILPGLTSRVRLCGAGINDGLPRVRWTFLDSIDFTVRCVNRA